LDLDQEAPISLPKLATAAAVDFTSDLKVTSVSAPALTAVTSLVDMSFTQATSISMPLFKGETGNADLSITSKAKSTIDISAYDTKSESTLLEIAHTLAVNGPSIVTLPLFVTGVLTTDAEVITLVGAKSAPVTTSTKLKEIHLHNLQGDLSLDATYAKLTIVDVIGTYELTGTATVVAGARTNDVTIGSAGLETLTLAGALGLVSITNASSLSSVTTSGGMRSFSLVGATDLSALTLGHGANSSSTLKMSNLVVTGATSLVTLTADTLNNASTLTIEDNTSLTKVSFAGLSAIATEDAVEAVSIKNNNLVAQSFQLPSPTGATPVVTGKITSDSGLGAMQSYLDKAIAAIAAVGSAVYVEYDDVLKATDAAGVVYEVGAAVTSASVTYALSKSVTVETAAGFAFIAINVSPSTFTYNSDAERKQTNTMVLQAGSALSDASTKNSTFLFNGGEGDVELELTAAWRSGIADYDRSVISTWAPEIAASMQTKITAAGYNYSLSAANDYGASAAYTMNLYSSTGAELNTGAVLSSGGVVWVGIGTSAQVSSTVVAAFVDSDTAFATTVVNAIEGTGSALSAAWSATVDADDGAVVILIKTATVKNTQDLNYTAYPSLTFGSYSTDTNTSALLSGASVVVNKVQSTGWRFTAVNNNLAVNAGNLEANQSFFTEGVTGGDNITFTAVPAAGQYAQSTGTLQVNYINVQAADTTANGGQPAGTTDYTAWM